MRKFWVSLSAAALLLGVQGLRADIINMGYTATEPAPRSAADGEPMHAGERLLQRLGTNQLRHGSRILCLAYAPNGKLLAAGGGADPVRMWDTETGQQKYTCPDTWVNAIAFSLKGGQFYTAGMFKTIKVWDTVDGKFDFQLVGHSAPIKALALNGEGTVLASGGQDGTLIIWEIGTRKKLAELKAHSDEITCMAFCSDPESSVLVTGSGDRTIAIWNADEQKLKRKINAGCGVLGVAVSRDGKRIFSAGDDNLIRVWKTKTGELLETLRGHDDMVVSLLLGNTSKLVDDEPALDRGKLLVSAARDKTIRVWRTDNLAAKPTIIPRRLGDSDALAISSDGKFLATAGLNNTIRVFATDNGKELFATGAPQAGLLGLTASRDGKRLAAVTATGSVYLWDAATGKLEREWATGHIGDVCLAFTMDGQSLVTAAETVRVWDVHTGMPRYTLPLELPKPVIGLALTLDGKSLAIGTSAGTVQVIDLDSKRVTDSFAYPGLPSALAFSLDQRLLAVAGSSKIVLRDYVAHNEVRRFDCKDAPPKTLLPDVAALAFSPDRKTLAVACFDGVIRILDFTTGKEIGLCEGHQSVPYAIAYAPDGRTLLSGSFDSTVRLWEPFSGALLADLHGHAGGVYGVALSPDARVAYSAGADTSVVSWDATGFGKAGPPKGAVNAEPFETVWLALASENAPAARQTVWRLIGSTPAGVVAELKKRVALVDVARINKLINDLDSEEYDTREAATMELEKVGRWLQGRLAEALVKPPSLEYKVRIEKLLAKLNAAGSLTLRQEQLRLKRTMMVLEYLGDDASIDLLNRLSRQAPEEAFRQEAQMTLQRLGRTPAKTAGSK